MIEIAQQVPAVFSEIKTEFASNERLTDPRVDDNNCSKGAFWWKMKAKL